MAKLAIFLGLALFVVAASALPSDDTENSAMMTTKYVCPTERPCCSCKCIPKECGNVPRAKNCQFVHCLIKCPHVCPHQSDDSEQQEITPTPKVVCPTQRPCCSCACPPKGCGPVPKPDHCKHIKCLIKCPHVCDNE